MEIKNVTGPRTDGYSTKLNVYHQVFSYNSILDIIGPVRAVIIHFISC